MSQLSPSHLILTTNGPMEEEQSLCSVGDEEKEAWRGEINNQDAGTGAHLPPGPRLLALGTDLHLRPIPHPQVPSPASPAMPCP